MFPKFSQIKTEARQGLSGIWSQAAWKEFIVCLVRGETTVAACIIEAIYAIILLVWINTTTDAKPLVAGITNTIVLVTILVHLIISLVRNGFASGMKIGLNHYYLELAENPRVQPRSGCFSHVIYFINQFTLSFIKDFYTALLTCLCIIPGIISQTKWGMAEFVIAEEPDTKASEAMTESSNMMEGLKMKLFLFNLSFIPLWLISIPTLIGPFYVQAYWHASLAKFYYYIKHPIVDKNAVNKLKSLEAEKFSFDDFLTEYEEKVAQKQKSKK